MVAAARASLTKRVCASLAVRVLRIDELDGDARPERRVAALPDRAHAAAADQPRRPRTCRRRERRVGCRGASAVRSCRSCLYIRRVSLTPLTREAMPRARVPSAPSAGAAAVRASSAEVELPRPEAARLPEAGATDVLYLIDLSGYVFRAYHALPPLSSSRGRADPRRPRHGEHAPEGRRRAAPALLAVAMDSQGPTFRHALDARYKATRPAPPPDLSQQMARVEQIVRAWDTPMLSARTARGRRSHRGGHRARDRGGVARRHRQRRQGPDAARPRRGRPRRALGLDARQGLRSEGGARKARRPAEPRARLSRAHRATRATTFRACRVSGRRRRRTSWRSSGRCSESTRASSRFRSRSFGRACASTRPTRASRRGSSRWTRALPSSGPRASSSGAART